MEHIRNKSLINTISLIIREELTKHGKPFKLKSINLSSGIQKLYHTSNPYFRKDIDKYGLQPSIGESYELHWTDPEQGYQNLPKCIFLSSEPYDSNYDDDLYEIDVSGLDKTQLYKDPETSGYMYMKPIPRNIIKRVYEGSDDSDCWHYGEQNINQ